MKTYTIFTILFFAIAFSACEDVIDVPVQTAATKLVIDASLDWEKGTIGNAQSITLRTSTPFFDTTSDAIVTGALVKVTNNTNSTEFVFVDQNNGAYTTTEFIPILGQSYTLEVIYNAETYTATETLNKVTEITDLFQGREEGFNDEELELHVVFTDPPEEENRYLFKFQRHDELLPVFEVGFDKFVNGNEIDWWYEEEDDDETDENEAIVPGDVVSIEMYGISETYYNYMEILINQIGGVGIFSATPVAVKGNCNNLTNPENYAHGYFRLTEVNKTSYTFE
ncbi:MAG: DUF4249 family protein [Flavobacteriaceae bacterium]